MENTRNLSEFWQRELLEASELLKAYANSNMTARAKERFTGNGLAVEFNPMSWNVFLVDDDYNVLMFNWEELDLFLSTPYEWVEGFFDEIMEDYEDLHEEDKQFMNELK